MASIMATAGSSTPFGRAYDNADLPKQDITALVMDYLIQEGYPAAAEQFAKEANIEKHDENALIAERVSIREAIYRGDLQTAIEEINEIDVQILDGNKPLHFSLLRLQLIELIRGVVPATETEKPALLETAVVFAQQNLAPYTPQKEQYRLDLEAAMALLIMPKEAWLHPPSQGQFEAQTAAYGPLWKLVDPSLKEQVARNVNAAILKAHERPEQSEMYKILQTRAWSENLAREKRVELPRDLGRVFDLQAALGETQSQNSNGDTQMTEDVDEATSRDAEQRYTNIHESSLR